MTIFKLPSWAEAIAGKRWNRVLVVLLRLVLGGVFMFSGFVKGIDPWGGYYKFIDYFNAYGFEHLASVSLFASFALAAPEFVLGLCVMVGAFRRGSVAILLMLLCVMLPLTLDLALTGRVADCGCFGDALVLSNRATFWKNVIMFPAMLYLLSFNRRVHGVYGPAVNWVVALFAFLFISAIAYLGYFYQPLIDFRPYKVGYNIGVPSAADINDDDYVFLYEKNGVTQEFPIDSLPDDDSGWTFIERRFKPGHEPQPRVIQKTVVILDHGNDVTEDVLPNHGKQLMFLFPDLPNVNIAYSFSLNELAEHAKQQGMTVVAASAADSTAVGEWLDISMASYPMYGMDDSELKMVARGNPAVVMVDGGKIKWKRTLSSLNEAHVRNKAFAVERLNDDYDDANLLGGAVWLLMLSMAGLLVLNRTHVLLLMFYRLMRKSRHAMATTKKSEEHSD